MPAKILKTDVIVPPPKDYIYKVTASMALPKGDRTTKEDIIEAVENSDFFKDSTNLIIQKIDYFKRVAHVTLYKIPKESNKNADK